MHDLTAQVTSSLLPFPEVTINALGEDEITLDSVLHGKFTIGRSGLAWLACGPHLEAVHAVTGERLSAYSFSGGGEHPPTVLATRDFSWLKRSGLLVGLEEAEGSVLCLYDLGLSRVVKAVVIPGRITAIEPLVSYGGASTSTQHLHQSLRWFFGIAAVVTDLGHVLLVDLCLDDLSCSQSELEASDLQVVTKSPAEIPRLREVSSRQGRHLCLQLNAPTGVGATALQYISRTNQLAVGFSDGYLQLWNMKALKKEYHSQLEGGRVPVYAFTFQEPENDPRNCCYLWAVQSSQDLDGDVVSLRLLQLAFSERKCLASGKILYEGLEYCEERYSQELSGTSFPLRTQATNTRLLNCQTIEKFRPHPDRDDSMNEVASPDTSVSIFSWQVKAYGQGMPATFIGVFDINRWYHAQMPDSLRTGESLQNCPYLAVWSLDPVMQMVSPHVLLDVVVHDRSLSRGLPFTCPPPEQYFNPTTYNFDATCLLNSGIVHLTCSGYQKETLSFLKKAAPCSSDVISTSYSRCLMSGLLSSRLADTQASSLSQEEQLDAILSTAVETSSLGLITGCIKQWTAEEQPGSALNLRYILDWAWNKVVQTKEELDGICAPLFDSSSNFTDPQTMQLLQHSQRLLSNLSTIFHCLLSEAQELTQKGLVGLMNKNMVSSLISKYAQVVLWFCRTGLLPEGPDDDALQISRPFYTHSVISSYYTIRREELTRLAKGKWCADCLMIDGLVGQCGEGLSNLWKRDEGGTGQYPPPTLHALLDIYLLDNIDEATKHAIVIYLLLDVMYSFPNKEGASVESFPTAFAIPIGLVKLVQGLWLLDHHDHQSSFELLLHPAASQCQFEWQHERVLQALMCQGQHSVALRYFHVTKPPISSTTQAKLCLSVLLHNRCLIEAWSLIRQHSSRLNMGELLGFLYENCQELGLIKELLKLPLGLPEQECLEKFLQGTGGLQNRELLMVHYLQQANYIPALQLNHSLKMNLVNERDPKLKERSNTRNSILDQYGKVLPRVQRKLAMERAKPYQHPGTIHREVSRPQPLSTITKRSAGEKVMSRAGFINNVLTKIEEVWLGKGATPQSSPVKSPRATDICSPSPKPSSLTLPDPFLGTPITMTSKRKSRLMELVVHPSCQTPRPIVSPPRPPTSWVSPKSIGKAPELSLLQTPQVVKRARALAASGPVFSAFTPQSILRSSLRPTPVATPSASPGRSITPPLRNKENRITFIEEAESPEPEKSIRWTNGMAAESEISLLTRGTTLSKAAHKTWSPQPAEEEADEPEEEAQPHVKFLPPEGGIPSPQLRCSESESSSIHEVTEETGPSASSHAQVSLSFETSHTSVRSTDTTLEYYDAPLSQDQEGEESPVDKDEDDGVVIVTIKTPEEKEELEQEPASAAEQAPLLSLNEGDGVKEDETFEDLMAACPEQEDKREVVVESEKEDEVDVESSTKQEDNVTPDPGELSSHGYNQVMEGTESVTESAPDVELQDQSVKPEAQDDLSEAIEAPEFTEGMKPSESTEAAKEPEDDLEQPTDLTDFVQQHLFGSDVASPLTRSGIHNASKTEVSFNSELLQEEEEELTAAKPALMLTTQKSITSVTSSEPTGTDSHSVVSVNDSEELSSPASEEEEDEEEDSDQAEEEEEEEEEDEEEEEEDSGSEVEIIEEVQGNGRLSPLQPGSVFVQQGQAHFLPPLSEQEAEVFSAEMKLVEDEMEGEVVMVRLGADEEEINPDEDDEQGSSYMELKPSTTLLVPLELVEEQDGLVHSSQLGLNELHHTCVPNDLRPETHSTFSLMLDVDEDGEKEADVLDNDPLSSNPYQSEVTDEPAATPEVILLTKNDGVTPPSGEGAQEELRVEMEELSRTEVDKPAELEPVECQTDLQEEPGVEMEESSRTEVDKPADLEPVEPQADLQAEPGVEMEELSRTEVDKPADLERVEPQADLQEVPGADLEELSRTEVDKPTELQLVEPQADLQEEPGVEMKELSRTEVDKPPDFEPVEVQGDLQEEPGVEMEELSRTQVDKPAELEPQADLQEELGVEMEELSKTEVAKPAELEPVEHQVDLQNENTEEKYMIEDVEQKKEVELVMLAEDNEPPTVSFSEPTPAEPPVIKDGNDIGDSAVMTDALVQEEMKEEDDKATSAEDQKELEGNVPFEKDVPEPQSGETVAAVEEEQEYTALTNAENDNQEEIQERKETKRAVGRPKKVKKSDEEEPVQQAVDSDTQPEENPVLDTSRSQRKKKAPSTPTRRTTRTRRTVTFISPLSEESDQTEEEGKVQEVETSSAVPMSPSRTPRKGRQVKETTVGTLRRSTRKVRPEPPKQEEADDAEEAIDNDTTVASPSRVSSPGRRQASQRATSTRTSQRNRSISEEVTTDTDVEIKEDKGETDEVKHPKFSGRRSAKTPTPAKGRTTQPSTPRRSSRRILSSSEETPTPLEVLKEEEESAPPVKHSSRKRKTQVAQPVLIEEEEDRKPQSPSPGRGTRQSNRTALNIYPQVKLVPLSYPQSVKKIQGETIIETINATGDRPKRDLNTSASQTTTRRPTRSKLWDHPEEDLLLLDSPLEVDSEIPVADALIKRLQDEEEKQEGGVVDSKTRASKRHAKSSVEQVRSLPPVQEPVEDESSPGEHSFIYSPSQRRTRASREVLPYPIDESTAPVTRSRRGAKAATISPQNEIASEEDNVEVDKVAAAVSKTRRTGKRTAKSKAVLEPAPVVEVDLLSPLPSPAEPVPRAQKRTKEANVPPSRMNLRRKRIMDTLLTKPLTRRKKL